LAERCKSFDAKHTKGKKATFKNLISQSNLSTINILTALGNLITLSNLHVKTICNFSSENDNCLKKPFLSPFDDFLLSLRFKQEMSPGSLNPIKRFSDLSINERRKIVKTGTQKSYFSV
jgi:hypothetical protein